MAFGPVQNVASRTACFVVNCAIPQTLYTVRNAAFRCTVDYHFMWYKDGMAFFLWNLTLATLAWFCMLVIKAVHVQMRIMMAWKLKLILLYHRAYFIVRYGIALVHRLMGLWFRKMSSCSIFHYIQQHPKALQPLFHLTVWRIFIYKLWSARLLPWNISWSYIKWHHRLLLQILRYVVLLLTKLILTQNCH